MNHNDERRPAKGRRIVELTGEVIADPTSRNRRDALRRALVAARRRKDVDSVALLVAWLSDEAAV